MARDEAKGWMRRNSHMDVFKKVQEAKVDTTKKLTHSCYVQMVGKIPSYERQPFSEQFDSEIVENCIEHATLYQDATELIKKREEYAVIEDDFRSTLEEMLKSGKTPSFRNLVDACSLYDKEKDIEQHYCKSSKNYMYFTQQGVDQDDAKAYAFAIAFYTGTYHQRLSRGANIVARRLVKDELTQAESAKVDCNAAMIMYYLIKGLSHIDSYWGVVKRYVELNDEDLNDYKPGEIVTWLQFSSSEKSGNTCHWFKDRNTTFTIFSLTGRQIRYFSNGGDEEDEVLFLPHSSFLVCRVEHDTKQKKHDIYLRQVELGLCKYVVLWVDDYIFHEHWENKRHMEKASTLGTGVNVHFISRSTTDSALAFLRSEFGQRLKGSDTFRIVTDMIRENEKSSRDAGPRLIYEVRKLGFNQMCLIFSVHRSEALGKLQKLFDLQKLSGVVITENNQELEEFVLFK